MQNVFLTLSLVKRFENRCMEVILIDYLLCLILQKVLLGHNSKIISLDKHFKSCSSEFSHGWDLGVGGTELRACRQKY